MENEKRIYHIYVAHRIGVNPPSYYVYLTERLNGENLETGERTYEWEARSIAAMKDTYEEAVAFLGKKISGKEYLKVGEDEAYYLE